MKKGATFTEKPPGRGHGCKRISLRLRKEEGRMGGPDEGKRMAGKRRLKGTKDEKKNWRTSLTFQTRDGGNPARGGGAQKSHEKRAGRDRGGINFVWKLLKHTLYQLGRTAGKKEIEDSDERSLQSTRIYGQSGPGNSMLGPSGLTYTTLQDNKRRLSWEVRGKKTKNERSEKKSLQGKKRDGIEEFRSMGTEELGPKRTR